MCALLLVACGGSPPPAPEPPCDRAETIQLRLLPRRQLNPDREGYSRSVVTRIFQLDKAEGFAALDFDALWDQPAGTPANPSVVASADELTLIPGRDEVLHVARNTRATHLAIAAKFREHHPNSGWQAVTALPIPTNACQVPEGPRLSVELVNYSLRFY